MEQNNFLQEQAKKSQENQQRVAALAREKISERIREADQKRLDGQRKLIQESEQKRAAELRAQDQKRSEAARAQDREKQDMRARAREHAKHQVAERVKSEMAKTQQNQQKLMAWSSKGPTMKPTSGNKERDQIEMAAEMDHPALTDDMKHELNRQGVKIGDGWHNREAKRKEDAAAELRKSMPKNQEKTSAPKAKKEFEFAREADEKTKSR